MSRSDMNLIMENSLLLDISSMIILLWILRHLVCREKRKGKIKRLFVYTKTYETALYKRYFPIRTFQ